jgi:para-nitrobenzyl esterase
MGNLPTNRVYDWQPEDFKVSAILQEYFANFIKTGNPNGSGVPLWPAANSGKSEKIMHIDVNTRAEEDTTRERYEWLDQFYNPDIP